VKGRILQEQLEAGQVRIMILKKRSDGRRSYMNFSIIWELWQEMEPNPAGTVSRHTHHEKQYEHTTEKNLLSECKLWLLDYSRPLVNQETCEQNNGRKLNRS
jgi:hypothetical protein